MNPANSSKGGKGKPKRSYKRKKGAAGKVVEGGFECEGCGRLSNTQSDANTHYRYNCPFFSRKKIKCRYCGKSMSPRSLNKHLGKFHKGQPKYDWREDASREKTAKDLELEAMLQEVGDPGREKEFRDGVLFHFDHVLRIGRYYFEEVDEHCLGSADDRKTAWISDKDLPHKSRISEDHVNAIRSFIWHFAHMVCASYHSFDELRKDMTKLSSVGCVQHAVVNDGAWKQLEIAFKFLCLLYRTFVISATCIGSNPEMVGEKKKVAKPEGFIKIAVVREKKEEGKWFWDAYYVPNSEESTKSPNAYRIESLVELDTLCEFQFLSEIWEVTEQRNLFEEGNAAKNRWYAEHPVPEEPETEENLPDSAIGMEFESQLPSQMDVEPQQDPKDVRIAELEARNAELEADNEALRMQLDVAYKRIKELEGGFLN